MKKNWKIIITLLLSGWLINSSCNSYKGIAKHEPKSTKDTARLAKRFIATFPAKPAEIKQGIEVKQLDSTDFFKQLLAIELAKKPTIKESIITKYIDSCKDVNEVYESAFKLGYEVGTFDGKSKCPPSTKRVDTFFKDSPQTLADLWLATTGVRALQDSLAIAKDKIARHQKNEGSLWWTVCNFISFRWVWLILLLTALYIFRKPLLLGIRKLINPLA